MPYRLLVVEDSRNIADMVCRLAEDLGFTTLYALGTAATEAYDDFQPHVVVLDIIMPEFDGLEFMKFLKTRDSVSKIVLMSGSSDLYRGAAENLGAARGLAIAANVPKPFRIADMRKVIEKIKDSLDLALKTAKSAN